MELAAALLALTTSTTPAPALAPAHASPWGAAPAWNEAQPHQTPAPPPARHITHARVVASLNALLQAEGLSVIAAGMPLIRPIDLDADASTQEALIDVVAPEHCDPAGLCQTLIVRALPCGHLAAIGHGRQLTPLLSRTHGHLDLGEMQWSFPFLQPVVVRALHWTGNHYRG